MEKDKKLTLEEQIDNLKSKNIKFDQESDYTKGLMTEKDAIKFLRYNTFYFHLKHYAHVFEIYKNSDTTKYVNLSFGKIVELSKLDMYFRRIVLHMCLDVEHLLKTRLLYDITINPNEDGKNIVDKYIGTLKNGYADYVGIKAKHKDSILSKLVAKFPDDQKELPAWKFVEVLSFGQFIDFYEFYFNTYNDRCKNNGVPNIVQYLDNICFLRNAAAHNSELLSHLNSKAEFEPTYNIKNIIFEAKAKAGKSIGNNGNNRKLFEGIDAGKQLKNHVIHDFITLLFLYRDLLKHSLNGGMYCRTIDELNALFNTEYGRMVLHREMFSKDIGLIQSYRFIVDVLIYIEQYNSSPKKRKKWILK